MSQLYGAWRERSFIPESGDGYYWNNGTTTQYYLCNTNCHNHFKVSDGTTNYVATESGMTVTQSFAVYKWICVTGAPAFDAFSYIGDRSTNTVVPGFSYFTKDVPDEWLTHQGHQYVRARGSSTHLPPGIEFCVAYPEIFGYVEYWSGMSVDGTQFTNAPTFLSMASLSSKLGFPYASYGRYFFTEEAASVTTQNWTVGECTYTNGSFDINTMTFLPGGWASGGGKSFWYSEDDSDPARPLYAGWLHQTSSPAFYYRNTDTSSIVSLPGIAIKVEGRMWNGSAYVNAPGNPAWDPKTNKTYVINSGWTQISNPQEGWDNCSLSCTNLSGLPAGASVSLVYTGRYTTYSDFGVREFPYWYENDPRMARPTSRLWTTGLVERMAVMDHMRMTVKLNPEVAGFLFTVSGTLVRTKTTNEVDVYSDPEGDNQQEAYDSARADLETTWTTMSWTETSNSYPAYALVYNSDMTYVDSDSDGTNDSWRTVLNASRSEWKWQINDGLRPMNAGDPFNYVVPFPLRFNCKGWVQWGEGGGAYAPASNFIDGAVVKGNIYTNPNPNIKTFPVGNGVRTIDDDWRPDKETSPSESCTTWYDPLTSNDWNEASYWGGNLYGQDALWVFEWDDPMSGFTNISAARP